MGIKKRHFKGHVNFPLHDETAAMTIEWKNEMAPAPLLLAHRPVSTGHAGLRKLLLVLSKASR